MSEKSLAEEADAEPALEDAEVQHASQPILPVSRQTAQQDSSSSDRPKRLASRSGSSTARRVSSPTGTKGTTAGYQDESSGNRLATHPPTAVQETTN